MANYDPATFEKRWQDEWAAKKVNAASNDSSKEKFYVLDMFPYPSGAGLHVGHPLGYIASDIYARFKRLQGFNVLHPMGYDAFGLPAEQYAIQTGQHPAITTRENIARYREQLDKIGFSFDWDREVRTCEPDYYKWTQWIFLKLFNSWYNPVSNKAEPIDTLVAQLEKRGFLGNDDQALTGGFEVDIPAFSEDEWQNFTGSQKNEFLLNFRLAYLSETYVNWCPALGTVLANEEVKEGVSERGGYPVERKKMKQWSLRITAYSERLLEGLDRIDWSTSIKDSQRNWIGKSEGSSIHFAIEGSDQSIEVFTTRPDTLFGVSFLTLAPEHSLVADITPAAHRSVINEYINKAKNRTERERMADVKNISGEFTGAYALHPFSGQRIPIWVGDYVLAGYGTGAVMAVPGHDSRDHAFAKHFKLPIIQVVQGKEDLDIQEASYDAKEGTIINSDFLDGLDVKAAIKKCITKLEEKGLGQGKTNYRLRDAIFGRQRYWGEPIPVAYSDGLPYALEEKELPLVLPEIDKFLPTEDGDPPLARAKGWKYETTTMPGWAGSSWYFLRYMDPKNVGEFASKEALDYWKNVDLYIGGSEHATGHLLYARFWMKFLYDLGYVKEDEPFKKLINQGMIQGVSEFIHYRLDKDKIEVSLANEHGGLQSPIKLAKRVARVFISHDCIRDREKETALGTASGHVMIQNTSNSVLNIREYLSSSLVETGKSYAFICDGGVIIDGETYDYSGNKIDRALKFTTKPEVEKMSKSKWNVVSPDEIIAKYGADTLRMYEMFLGPLEMAKPWNTNGIEGVYRFLGKLWKLYIGENNETLVNNDPATKDELKVLHKTIKKVKEDIEGFSFNTSVSTFMIAVNELSGFKCHKREILEPMLILLSPFAPHVAEELWVRIGNGFSVTQQQFPALDASFLVENSFSYPISINGKTRTQIEMPLDMSQEDAEKLVLANEIVQKWLEGKTLKKFVFVKGRIVNVVV
ncbi:MAG TPA: leucine--tRNA ligase [Bacteroidetes bacterium]|nr:leucine--tRNA ligase [Bacteroidota bacterium]